MSTFGSEVDAVWPPSNDECKLNISPFGQKLLKQCTSVKKPDPEAKVNISAFMRKSTEFPLEFGVQSCRVQSQPAARHECIGKQIASVYPVIHEHTLALYLQYLEHKGKWGNTIEQRIYRHLSLCDFVQRLLAKRCASFFARNGKRGASGFEPIGTAKEKPPLYLERVLSYDDVKLSALLSVSSHTEFINEGERTNCGSVPHNRKNLQPEGVIVGVIGARLSRSNLVEFQDIVIARTQNTKIIQDSCDLLLLEAEARAAKAGKLAYIHVVGFGLGVWQVAPQQEQIFLETFEQRLRVLGKRLSHIGVVHFSWFKLERCGGLHNGAVLKCADHPEGGIRVLISKRDPAQKLSQPEHANMLLVVSYAWDGNALPGNEFWMKMLKSTGVSSTACSTLIPELHNPHINTDYCSGQNLHIASVKYGIIHISDYAKRLLKE